MNSRFWVVAWGALAFLSPLSVALAQSAKAQPADYVVAVVNSEPITHSELRAAMARVSTQLQAQGQPQPPAERLQKEVLERLISDRAQLQLAAERGVQVDDASVELAEQNLARQNQVDVPGLRQRLAQDGVSSDALRTQLREQLTLTRLREREVESRIRISDQEVDRAMAEQLAANTDPMVQEINIANLLVAVPERADDSQVAQLQAQAQGLLERARAGENFTALVQQYSNADRTNGGALGLRRGERYPPAFVAATQGLPVGGVSELVRSGAGFHVLKLLERRAPSVLTKSVQQTRARHILLRTSPEVSAFTASSRLSELRQRLVSGKADFAALAREFSQDGSAPQGGDLGWVSPGTFVPEFEDAMNRLAEGEVSPPVVSRFGVHLIVVTDRRRVELGPREVREVVRAQLRDAKLEEAYASWSQEVRERAYVELREAPL